MALIDNVLKIRARPTSLPTEARVTAFGAFLHGYRSANSGDDDTISHLANGFKGPRVADACTRAYLQFEHTEIALAAVLDALRTMLEKRGETIPGCGHGAESGLLEVIRESINSGRPGVVFGEPTVTWCANFVQDDIAGLESVDPVGSARLRDEIENFSTWLRQRYECESCSWYAIIRVYGGNDIDGLRLLIQTWDSYRADIQLNS